MSVLHFFSLGVALAAASALPGGDGAMVAVPAGEFVRGDASGEPDERPPQRLILPAFAIDRTEVTRAAYGACVSKGACHPPLTPKGPATDLAAPESAMLPVTRVSWLDAAAYCAFAGKRLPTEAEWEKAARGTDGRRYPWGNDLSCARGNFGNFAGDGRCADEGAPGQPVAVGSYPGGASPYGALDLAGNVWEWVADAYAADAYQRPPRPPRQAIAAAAAQAASPTQRRVLRGGGCCSIFGLPRSADRLALPASYRDTDIGFRCARDQLPPAPPPSAPAAAGRAP